MWGCTVFTRPSFLPWRRVWERDYLSSSLSGFMTSATLIHSWAYNGQGPLTSECFSRLKTVYSARNEAPKKAEKPYLCPFMSKRSAGGNCIPSVNLLGVGDRPFLPAHNRQCVCVCVCVWLYLHSGTGNQIYIGTQSSSHKTYFQNELCQLITCCQSFMTITVVINGWRVNGWGIYDIMG